MNDFNPLNVLFQIFPSKEPVSLTPYMLSGVKLALFAGDVHCETAQDVFKCLEIFKEMGILSIVTDENSIKIGNLYNGY